MNDPCGQGPESQARRGWFRRHIVKFLIILVAVGALVGISAVPPRDREAPPGEAPPVNVKVMEIVAVPELADTFSLPAVVEPNRVVTIAAEIAARVEKIPLKEGDPVKAGALLVQLNKDLIEPALRAAEAQQERKRIEFERMQSLVSENATSRQDLDNAVSELAASRASLEEAQARLDRTTIASPAGGVLNELLVEEGEYVQPGTPVAEVVEMDPVKVNVDVPERDIAFFEVGSQAEVFAQVKDSERQVIGTITYIDELADPQTRTTAMEITMDNPDRVLRSGQIVRVRLTRRIIEDAVMIPLAAVIPMETGYAVYVAQDSEAKRLEDIELGLIKGDNVRIVQGLEPGQLLMVDGHRFVAPGQKINIVSQVPE